MAKKIRVDAWRNLLLAGINEALDRKLFGLKEDENYWTPDPGRTGCSFDFTFDDIPMICGIHDIGFGELAIHSAAYPKPDGRRYLNCCGNIGFLPGMAHAAGWLERRTGCWLQSPGSKLSMFKCKTAVLDRLGKLNVVPNGYAPSGRFFF